MRMDVAIIGGGSCGLITACLASQAGLKTILFEKQDRVGRKLLAAGNGWCNLANQDFSMDHYHGSAAGAAEKVFEVYGAEAIEAFWRDMGIEYAVRENGRCYPRSFQAASVVNALRRALRCQEKKNLLTLSLESAVTGLSWNEAEQAFSLKVQNPNNGVKGQTCQARAVVLASGGKASPMLGGCEDGYALAKSLHLPVTDLRPAICRLMSDDPQLKMLAGVRTTVPLSLYKDNTLVKTITDEILFTKESLSGPGALALSFHAGELLKNRQAGEKIFVKLDLAEEYSQGALFAYLSSRFAALEDANMLEALEGWMGRTLSLAVLKRCGINPNEAADALGKKKLGQLAAEMKAFSFEIKALDSFKDAQVTVGGIHASSLGDGLRSKKYPRLYLGGEVLDLNGDCGGYNLMFACASALWIANALSADLA
ncbi:MAG: aminoacetone oxidase family FAD-binding enzyme [Firmicutes bacterium]|nr:aminoacetone oxidase family FAD-binding enzyme [Bacillota bacterium]